ncbi:MAG: IS66 family insertion sequence element accessory protein TnpB, partial [Geodermatophilaceae bacterium]|nr:IS66 family insertion sequence element accessory protein TnpB [Geodermatophilaceae bacterium]
MRLRPSAIGMLNGVWLGSLLKLLWHDGIGLCLLAKRLERGHFVWPMTSTGTVSLTPAQ